MTYPDFAEALQARILADLRTDRIGHAGQRSHDCDDRSRIGALEAHVAVLEGTVAKAEAWSQHQCRQAETAVKQVKILQGQIVALEQANAVAEAQAQQYRQAAECAGNHVKALQANIGSLNGRIAKAEILSADLHARVAELEQAIGRAKIARHQQQLELERANKQVTTLEGQIANLTGALAQAKGLAEQRGQEARSASKRADDLVAELVTVTAELIDMSKRMGEQTTLAEKVRAELDEFRNKSWWWQHSSG